jgi:ABC-type transporter Mla MlaB component
MSCSRTWLMRLVGEHDLSTVPLLERERAAMLGLCTSTVVDLRGATFIDCSTVTWLLETKRMCDGSGTHLRVVDGLGRFAARVLDLTARRDALDGRPPRSRSLAGAASDPAVTAAGALAWPPRCSGPAPALAERRRPCSASRQSGSGASC